MKQDLPHGTKLRISDVKEPLDEREHAKHDEGNHCHGNPNYFYPIGLGHDTAYSKEKGPAVRRG